MQNTSLWDLSKMADGNVRLSVDGKAVNGPEFFRSLVQPEISQTYQISRQQALKRARNQVIVAALMGEDRLYRRRE